MKDKWQWKKGQRDAMLSALKEEEGGCEPGNVWGF